jgi:hypothetical protein
MQFERKSIYVPKSIIGWVNAQAKKKKLNFSSMITLILKEAKEAQKLTIFTFTGLPEKPAAKVKKK